MEAILSDTKPCVSYSTTGGAGVATLLGDFTDAAPRLLCRFKCCGEVLPRRQLLRLLGDDAPGLPPRVVLGVLGVLLACGDGGVGFGSATVAPLAARMRVAKAESDRWQPSSNN